MDILFLAMQFVKLQRNNRVNSSMARWEEAIINSSNHEKKSEKAVFLFSPFLFLKSSYNIFLRVVINHFKSA